MDAIRHALGLPPAVPPALPEMTTEQAIVAERLRRIAARQQAIDIQVDVLAADRRDLLVPRRGRRS